MTAWKTTTIKIAITQRRLFYETGAFDKNARISNAIQPVTGGEWCLGTAHRQMVQQQPVEIQQGWLSIVANQ